MLPELKFSLIITDTVKFCKRYIYIFAAFYTKIRCLIKYYNFKANLLSQNVFWSGF